MLTEDNVRRYLRVLYPVGLLLVLVPLVDLTLRAMPAQFGSLQWRFASVGLLLGNYGTIILGATLIGLAAVLLGDRGVLRALGIVALVMAALTLAVLVLFALDAVQIRQLVVANLKRQVLTSSASALFTGLAGTIVWLLVGRAALVASRPARGTAAPRSRAASSLVVGSPAAGTSEAV